MLVMAADLRELHGVEQIWALDTRSARRIRRDGRALGHCRAVASRRQRGPAQLEFRDVASITARTASWFARSTACRWPSSGEMVAIYGPSAPARARCCASPRASRPQMRARSWSTARRHADVAQGGGLQAAHLGLDRAGGRPARGRDGGGQRGDKASCSRRSPGRGGQSPASGDLGLGGPAEERDETLSLGERQRVMVARALSPAAAG